MNYSNQSSELASPIETSGFPLTSGNSISNKDLITVKTDLTKPNGNGQPTAETVDSVSECKSTPIVTDGSNATADNPAPDPFDPESLRLSQDFGSGMGVKKILTTVRCGKPNRHEFVRVCVGDDWQLETGVFEDKVHRELYLVERHLWPELAGDVYPVCLFLAANRQGDVFLWPVKLPGQDGRSNTWNDSALAAAKLAESKWIRLAANMTAGMYDTFQAICELSEPEWPELSFSEILKLSFRDRFIRDMDHPVLRALRGEV